MSLDSLRLLKENELINKINISGKLPPFPTWMTGPAILVLNHLCEGVWAQRLWPLTSHQIFWDAGRHLSGGSSVCQNSEAGENLLLGNCSYLPPASRGMACVGWGCWLLGWARMRHRHSLTRNPALEGKQIRDQHLTKPVSFYHISDEDCQLPFRCEFARLGMDGATAPALYSSRTSRFEKVTSKWSLSKNRLWQTSAPALHHVALPPFTQRCG